MSCSSSSTECNCDEYCYYGANFKDVQRNLFHPTMAHPLIYYAQLQQPNGTLRGSGTRKNKNCFVKAFRWYTEEHTSSGRKHSPDANLTGFATWLDNKYEQFLRDSQLDQNIHSWRMRQTSTIEANKFPANAVCEPCSAKKYTRVRRPWRKRRRPVNNNEAGDVQHKSNQSFEYILHPKDLSRPVSECCHTVNTSSCCNRSNATVASSDTQIIKKVTAKSQSLTSVRQKKETPKLPIDVINIHEAANIKRTTFVREKDKMKIEIKTSQSTEPPDVGKKYQKILNTACQCSERNIVKVNAQSQYESSVTKTSPYNNYYENKPQMIVKESPHQFSQQEPYWSKLEQVQPHSVNVNETDSFIVKNLATLTKTTRSFTIFISDTAQTSDHSIKLDEDAIHEYPVFVKLICATELNKKLNK